MYVDKTGRVAQPYSEFWGPSVPHHPGFGDQPNFNLNPDTVDWVINWIANSPRATWNMVVSILGTLNDALLLVGDAAGVPGSMSAGVGAAAAASNESSFVAALASALASLAASAVAAPIMFVDPTSAILINMAAESWMRNHIYNFLNSLGSLPVAGVRDPELFPPGMEGWEWSHDIDALIGLLNSQRECAQ